MMNDTKKLKFMITTRLNQYVSGPDNGLRAEGCESQKVT
jgi:hypothetical protein